jgi:hypothetical protein
LCFWVHHKIVQKQEAIAYNHHKSGIHKTSHPNWVCSYLASLTSRLDESYKSVEKHLMSGLDLVYTYLGQQPTTPNAIERVQNIRIGATHHSQKM